MTCRLTSPKSPILTALKSFLENERFGAALADKFGVSLEDCSVDTGIQKYLDGYEISPHPDIRRKALTFMVNINPHANAEALDHHTHYMRFTPERRYVQAYWDGNEDVDRCWVPWDWCETETMQRKNNSIVIFAPSNQTMHAVRANYDHLAGQRTQLYGNLWYNQPDPDRRLEWEDFDFTAHASLRPSAPGGRDLAALVPKPVRSALRKVLKRGNKEVGARNVN